MSFWAKHPEEFTAAEHVFDYVGSVPSTSDTTTYEYACRFCKVRVYGKYLYDDADKVTYSFYITTPMDSLEVSCAEQVRKSQR